MELGTVLEGDEGEAGDYEGDDCADGDKGSATASFRDLNIIIGAVVIFNFAAAVSFGI